MELLGDDELLSIFDKVHDDRDRISFYRVSKQFLKVACIRLQRLPILSPHLLKYILHASANMVTFKCDKPLSNTYMELLARSCPNLKRLWLNSEEGDFQFDFDDDGLCAVAKACSRLSGVELYGRLHVGDIGVDCLVRSCKDLRNLILSRCARVTDESLKSIRELNSLQRLDLEGCLISDMGLEYMAKADLKNNLMSLSLDECDKISDIDISHLKQMVNLTRLSLSNCGVNITDSGIFTLSQIIPNIEVLHLSWLINITDISLSQIARNCKKLKFIELRGCEAITGKGVRCFAHHPRLSSLYMSSCYNIFWEDVESVASTCRNLEHIELSRRIKTPMPNATLQELLIQGKQLIIWWRD
ncbi:Leucine-rich repeat, cysteine-containing subtype [Artemisia annua]|uniref:Leucine-rich repeat, cysteine-containing subtype n=1 Tax=Artemisia annua TaxID=35608 RepID=A0A2U1L2X5_ARTAN|nr:Leucine-rich repeat, cysteine-containing subtype [Artemisia annua]